MNETRLSSLYARAASGCPEGWTPAPDSAPLTHVTVTVHAQRLDLGGLLLLVLGAEGPEQGPRGWRTGRGGRGPNCSPRPRGTGLHSPTGRHHLHALLRK